LANARSKLFSRRQPVGRRSIKKAGGGAKRSIKSRIVPRVIRVRPEPRSINPNPRIKSNIKSVPAFKTVEPVVKQVGFLKKIGKGFKKAGKTFGRVITRPISLIAGKDIVKRRGTFFDKGIGRAFDKGMAFTTKATGIIGAAVVGTKLASGVGAKKLKLTTGVNPPKNMGFLSKLTKSNFLKTAFSGAKKSLISAGLSSFNVGSPSQGDIESTSLLGIGNKKREEAKKQRTFWIVLAGLALTAIGLLVAIFKK